jgi:hypothetical protein
VREQNNLASQMPDKVNELGALMDKFLRDTHAVVPKPNPSYRKPAVRPFALPDPDDVA